jgi:hypothetical protein
MLRLFETSNRRDHSHAPICFKPGQANLKGEGARKVVDKLIRAGLLVEVRAGGTLPVWRHDDDSGPRALRITKSGLEAIDVGPSPLKRPSPLIINSRW